MTIADSAAKRGWADVGERGSVLAIRFAVFVATFLGRSIGRLIARLVAFYYALFAPHARRAASQFLMRLHGRVATRRQVDRQILRFVQTTLDAFFLVAGRTEYFRVRTHGDHHLAAVGPHPEVVQARGDPARRSPRELLRDARAERGRATPTPRGRLHQER